MKRIFIFAASVLSVIGCTLTTPKSPEVTAYNLQVYSSLELGKCVAMPSVLTSVMAEFDEYLKKSKEEMLMDEVFNGTVTFKGEDTYEIHLREPYLMCTVDTDGKSIFENDAVWTVSDIYYSDVYTDGAIGVSLDVRVSGESALTKVSDSTWFFESEGIETTVKLAAEDPLGGWIVEGRSVDIGTDHMWSQSTTGEGGIKVYSHNNLSYNGTFTTEIYKEDEQLDFCTFSFRPGSTSSVTTSRD